MKTITIDILNSKAIKLLQDLETLKLIRMRKENTPTEAHVNWADKYKGSITKQPLSDISHQLKELRNAWE